MPSAPRSPSKQPPEPNPLHSQAARSARQTIKPGVVAIHLPISGTTTRRIGANPSVSAGQWATGPISGGCQERLHAPLTVRSVRPSALLRYVIRACRPAQPRPSNKGTQAARSGNKVVMKWLRTLRVEALKPVTCGFAPPTGLEPVTFRLLTDQFGVDGYEPILCSSNRFVRIGYLQMCKDSD